MFSPATSFLSQRADLPVATARTGILDRIAETFPSTPLFLGAAETIWQVSNRFIAVPVGDTFIYRQAIADPVGLKTRTQDASAGNGRTSVKTAVRTNSPRPAARHQESRRRSVPETATGQHPTEPDSATSIDQLAKVAHDAIATGDCYRSGGLSKVRYLAPDDPVAQLHLGLALEAAGDEPSAQRAYAAARQALLRADSANVPAFKGYATAELVSLLDSKQRRATR
jgi:chemotaxis protein methyltransferase CheR